MRPFRSASQLSAGALTALAVAAASACNHMIPVAPVNYTFTAPLVSLPVGLKAPLDRREAFAQVFCKALEQDPSRAHDDCNKYLQLQSFVADDSPVPQLQPESYQVIIVAGIFSACLPKDKVSIFRQGIEQLKREDVIVAEIPVSASGGTDEHAKTIGEYVRSHQDPKRKFIAIGYSQGAADLLHAYVMDPVVHDSMAALITVAGAVGGSRLPDGIPRMLQPFLDALNVPLPGCPVRGLAGLDALRRQVRYDFLYAHRDSLPRSYSIAGVSTKDTTSKILQGFWDRLTAYSEDQDSQVIRDEAVVPGGAFLGTARADHWAISLPFKEAHDDTLDRLVDHNDYPRTVLLEAMVRYVMKDLKDGAGQATVARCGPCYPRRSTAF